MPRFHLPTRSPPNGLRPSLELSPDYVRARLEEDRATLAGYLESQHASPRPLHCHPLSTLGTRKGPDIVGPLPSISYTDRALQGLPEVDETDKDSTLKGGEDFLTEREVVSVDLSEPALKPIRQFYRKRPPIFFIAGELSVALPQGQLLGLVLAAYQGLIQSSGVWSFSSCTLWFFFFFPLFIRTSA